MKKLVSVLAILVWTTGALGVTSLPEGEYIGRARWKDNQGNTGAYKKEILIQGGQVASDYIYVEGKRKYVFHATLDAQGYFPVLIDGKQMGTGYCGSVQCHYSVSIGSTITEETFTFKDEMLYILGSKTLGDKVVIWEEVLIKESK